ncbi:hypothetical protein C8R44DRAFT_973920 [Mycena epipterygia]|nr:hypothetical protein C8R44DRAFT_973920 [Mycena epipterygia]
MNSPHPLRIQELLEQCTEFLHDSVSDLKACALVSRSWASAAQFRIFRNVSMALLDTPKNEWRWSRLQEALRASPHLIPYIHRLKVNTSYMSTKTFSDISTYPFTRLVHVHIRTVTLSLHSVIDMQRLVSLPTLRRLSIQCAFPEPSTFLRIWERCSPGITHLELRCVQQGTGGWLPIPQRSAAPLKLESLWIPFLEDLSEWLTHPSCPFDFSGLKAIAIAGNTKILHWQKIQPALQTIRVLDFHAYHLYPHVDLSSLPNLTFLRIDVSPEEVGSLVSRTLITISPTSCIRKIVIASFSLITSTEWAHDWQQLDRTLATLPTSHVPIVELEMPTGEYDRLVPVLPYLSVTKLLQRSDPNDRWFEAQGFIDTM